MRPLSLPLLVPVAAALGLAATASAANAGTLCVGPQAAGISCDTQYPFTGTGLSNAFAAANGNAPTADTVRVAAGSLTGLAPLTLAGATDALVGAGRNQTSLTFVGSSGSLLTLGSNGSTSARDLEVRSTSFTANGVVLQIGNGGLAERVRVVEQTPANASGVRTVGVGTGATLRDADVVINSNQDVGVSISTGGATIEDTTITGGGGGYAGVQASSVSGTVQLSRLRITGVSLGVTTDGGAFNLDDSVIDLGSTPNATGIRGQNFNPSSSTITAQIRRSTFVGSGPNQTGIWDNADNAGETVTTAVRDSLLRLTGAGSKDLHCGDVGLAGTSSLVTLNTGYGALAVHTPTCPHTSTADLNLAATPPIFVNAAAGDYRPMWNSPVVDRGTNAAPGATTDLLGGVRLVDGDGDGAALVDLGANEYQHQPPTAPTTTTIPVAGSIDEILSFSASGATDPDADPIVDYAWDFGDGSTGTGAAINHAYSAGGTYTVSVRAKDASGLLGAPSSTTLTVPAAATPAPTQASGGTPTPTPTPAASPKVRIVTSPINAIKRGKRGFTTPAKASGVSTTLAVTGAAQLRLTVARYAAGRKTTKGCSRTSHRGKRCSLRIALTGSATVAVKTGTMNLAFGGTFAGKRLPAGDYAITVTPVSASGTAGTPTSYRVKLR